MTPAGFWPRCAAWSLDAAIVAVPVLIFAVPQSLAQVPAVKLAFAHLMQQMTSMMDTALATAASPQSLLQTWLADPVLRAMSDQLETALWRCARPVLAGFALIAALYWIGFERSAWQATPGKRALRLVVTDLDGERLDTARAIGRHVAGTLSWLTLNLGHAMAALPPQKRALHDHIAGTRVLGPGTLPAWALAWLLLQAVIAVVATAWLMSAASQAMQNAVDRLILG